MQRLSELQRALILLLCVTLALNSSALIQAVIPAVVPPAYKVGNSAKFQLAGTVAGTGVSLCTDASLNTTTSGCSGGGTTPTQMSINSFYYPNPHPVSATTYHVPLIGDNDVYTVPVGRKAFLGTVFYNNDSNASVVLYTEVKISGVYYPLQGHLTVTTGGTNANNVSTQSIGYILNAGDILATNVSVANVVNFYSTITEFDASGSIVKTVPLTSYAAGNNTVYTCPALHNCNMISSDQLPGLYRIPIVNATGAGFDAYYNLVPSGGSPTTSNRLGLVSLGISNNSTQSVNISCTMKAGDFLNFNTSVSTAGIFTYVTVAEIPN